MCVCFHLTDFPGIPAGIDFSDFFYSETTERKKDGNIAGSWTGAGLVYTKRERESVYVFAAFFREVVCTIFA
jgi:hypothetical protein